MRKTSQVSEGFCCADANVRGEVCTCVGGSRVVECIRGLCITALGGVLDGEKDTDLLGTLWLRSSRMGAGVGDTLWIGSVACHEK